MWNRTSKCEMEQAKVKSNKQMWNWTAINLDSRVLSVLRESTLVAADHVSARFQKNKGRERQDSESFVLHVNWYLLYRVKSFTQYTDAMYFLSDFTWSHVTLNSHNTTSPFLSNSQRKKQDITWNSPSHQFKLERLHDNVKCSFSNVQTLRWVTDMPWPCDNVRCILSVR